MIIGVPKEIKPQECRVGVVPHSVQALVKQGHDVIVEREAGVGTGIPDAEYVAAGARMTNDAKFVYAEADIIVKVKEPQPSEWSLLRENHVLFAYLHLAPNAALTAALIQSRCTAIAYETVTNQDGSLPLLAPTSEVAGRLSIQAGAHALEKASGGCGILLGGVQGVVPAKVVVIGGGHVGEQAVLIAMGMQANVTVLDRSESRLHALIRKFGPRLTTAIATPETIEAECITADLVIGAVLVPGATAPKLLSRAALKRMRPGSVLVDVAIDQGGCFESSRPTTHQNPTYIEDHVVHYCVMNMPAAVPRTSTFALNNATLPYILQLANKGVTQALLGDEYFLTGLNIHRGLVTHPAVAKDLNYHFTPPREALAE